jgi:hypothetical protein
MATLEHCYKIGEIARHWNVSEGTVRKVFADEPGVLRIGKPSRFLTKSTNVGTGRCVFPRVCFGV